MRSPAAVIKESRDLEGVAVDAGPDGNLSHEDRVGRLTALAAQVRATAAGSMEQALLVQRYNILLYTLTAWLQFHGAELPEAARIGDDLTLNEYLEHRAFLHSRGPVTLTDFWHWFPIIAHIRVKRHRRFWSPHITIETHRVFKGSLPAAGRYCYDTGFGGRLHYESRTEYLVFWTGLNPVMGGDPMQVFDLGHRRVIRAGCAPKFWPFPANLVGEWSTEVPLETVLETLNNYILNPPQITVKSLFSP